MASIKPLIVIAASLVVGAAFAQGTHVGNRNPAAFQGSHGPGGNLWQSGNGVGGSLIEPFAQGGGQPGVGNLDQGSKGGPDDYVAFQGGGAGSPGSSLAPILALQGGHSPGGKPKPKPIPKPKALKQNGGDRGARKTKRGHEGGGSRKAKFGGNEGHSRTGMMGDGRKAKRGHTIGNGRKALSWLYDFGVEGTRP